MIVTLSAFKKMILSLPETFEREVLSMISETINGKNAQMAEEAYVNTL